MRVTLSVEHIVKFIEVGGLDKIPSLSKYKKSIESGYNELKRLTALVNNPAGCTSCAQKNLKNRKYSLLTITVMALNTARDSGESLQPLIDTVSEIQKQAITQLDMVIPQSASPMPQAPRTPAVNRNVNKSVVLPGVNR